MENNLDSEKERVIAGLYAVIAEGGLILSEKITLNNAATLLINNRSPERVAEMEKELLGLKW